MSSGMGKIGNMGILPEWDLGGLFPSMSSPLVEKCLAGARVDAQKLADKYRGKIGALEANELFDLIKDYESLQDRLGRISSFSQLIYAADMGDEKNGGFYQTMQEKCTEIAAVLLFVTLEINRLDSSRVEQLLESPVLGAYGAWIRDCRIFGPYQLSDDVEAILLDKTVTGRAAWVRLFDETISNLKFHYDGKILNSSEAFDLLASSDGTIRGGIAREISKVLTDQSQTLTLITNTLIKDKEIEDNKRNFGAPISMRNLENLVEDEIVESLIGAVEKSYPNLSHRYYRMKAKWLGQEKLNYWDRNAPLPEDDDRLISWEEARSLVLSAYDGFSPKMAQIAERFFKSEWIDAGVRSGKAPGAFSHPTVPSANPYVLLNYQGKVRDVMTLAHELGHGVHQVLAAGQGALLADTPLTLAETASVFGEQLTFRSMLSKEESPVRRKLMLAGKVEDMLNTVVRQISFCQFERKLHDLRPSGELSSEVIGQAWMEEQRKSLGPGIDLHEDYSVYWSYIPHFIHTPFYVYAYAFGDCLVNSLYGIYQSSADGFEEKYLDMLRAGGSKRHFELLKPFGLDAGNSSFWYEGLKVIEGFIDELENG